MTMVEPSGLASGKSGACVETNPSSPSNDASVTSEAAINDAYNQILGYHNDGVKQDVKMVGRVSSLMSESVYSGAPTVAGVEEIEEDEENQDDADFPEDTRPNHSVPFKSLDPDLISASSSLCSVTDPQPQTVTKAPKAMVLSKMMGKITRNSNKRGENLPTDTSVKGSTEKGKSGVSVSVADSKQSAHGSKAASINSGINDAKLAGEDTGDDAVSRIMSNILPVKIDENDDSSEIELTYGDLGVMADVGAKVLVDETGESSPGETTTEQAKNIQEPGDINITGISSFWSMKSDVLESKPEQLSQKNGIESNPEHKLPISRIGSRISISDTASLTVASGEYLEQERPIVYHAKEKAGFFERLFTCNGNTTSTFQEELIADDSSEKEDASNESQDGSISHQKDSAYTTVQQDMNNDGTSTIASDGSAWKPNDVQFNKEAPGTAAAPTVRVHQKEESIENDHIKSLGPGIHLFNANSYEGDGIEIMKILVKEEEEVEHGDASTGKRGGSSNRKNSKLISRLRVRQMKPYVLKPLRRGKLSAKTEQ